MCGSEIVLWMKSIFMGQVIGLGGVFIKAKDPKGLSAWYEQNLGINFSGNVYTVFPFTDRENNVSPGYNILSFFDNDSKYFDPAQKQTMINLRVDDLDGLLAKLRRDGVTIVGDPIDEVYGKFGWIMDPEGNKIELWQPPAEGAPQE